MFDDDVVLLEIEIVVGTKPEQVVLLLGRRIDPTSLVPAEGSIGVVLRDDVLAKFRAESLKQVAEMSHDRKAAEDGVLGLNQVVDGNENERSGESDTDPGPHGRHNTQQASSLSGTGPQPRRRPKRAYRTSAYKVG